MPHEQLLRLSPLICPTAHAHSNESAAVGQTHSRRFAELWRPTLTPYAAPKGDAPRPNGKTSKPVFPKARFGRAELACIVCVLKLCSGCGFSLTPFVSPCIQVDLRTSIGLDTSIFQEGRDVADQRTGHWLRSSLQLVNSSNQLATFD